MVAPQLGLLARGAVRQLSLLFCEDALATALVLAFAVTQLASICWDLPCTYGWENDAVAPRDLFGGLYFNLIPHNGHRYPLFHYLLLALTSLPVLLVSTCIGLARGALIDTILSPWTLTLLAFVAKLVSVAMGMLALLALARITRRLFGRTAGLLAVCFAATNLSVSYYARSTNLDGPYLTWGLLALDRFLDVLERGESRDYRAVGILAALAVATKDQAYALFALSVPAFLAWQAFARRRELPAGANHAKRAWQGSLAFVACYAVVSGALVNPTGLLYRVRLLAGPNTADYRQYQASWSGALANLEDLARALPDFWWPWPVLVLAGLGVLASGSPGRTRSALSTAQAKLAPLAMGSSGLVAFTLVSARCEHRFVLPIGALLSCYAGHGGAWLLRRATARPQQAMVLACLALMLGAAAGQSLALHLTQRGDSRKLVKAWLDRLPPGSTVETYGPGVYLPVFDGSAQAPYRVERVGPTGRPRPAIAGVTERYEALGVFASRASDVLVIPEGFASRFLDAGLVGGARIHPALYVENRRQLDAVGFFEAALRDALPGYRMALVALPQLPAWARALGLSPVSIHGSTGTATYVLAREQPRATRR